jgi:pyridoxal phosphate enzyme (YggS family)
MKTISRNIEQLKEEVATAAVKCGRNPDEIRIVGVSKRHPYTYIKEAYNSGLKLIGENRVQEAYDKYKILQNLDVEWHMIGHLQKNKVKTAAKFFNCIHSLDSFELAEKLDKYLAREKRTMKAFLQPKLSYEESKTGVPLLELEKVAYKISQLDNIELIGLMAIPPFTEDPKDSAPYFAKLRMQLEHLNSTIFKTNNLKHLSMGMTHDFHVAITEGATYIRVGTKIFGSRR